MGKIIDSPDLIETGDRIRLMRQKAGLTQEALADEMGVAWNTVHRIEYAQAAMGIDKLYQIADILHVPVQELCPARFAAKTQDDDPSGILAAYDRLSEKNRKVVVDTVTALINGLLAQQETLQMKI